MPLQSGDRLGPYEIIARIGAGGMGEVYRAKDNKLKRDVALKVLPETFARDPDRMARLQREAEVLASLNHPNIAHIYGIEGHALVMELVEGKSPKGPMPFEEAWKIGLQIADALEYAHEKSVIHRDLKPANLKVTPDGVVKLLDFGLAKAVEQASGCEELQSPSDGSVADSPTVTLGATVAGTILGTAGYMAPEQAQGKKVDKRVDIWSWGVLLYELLTGERMFKGADVADTLAQMLTKQPDLDRVPANVRRLLGRCLEKNPKQRLRDIGEARFLREDATLAKDPPPWPALPARMAWSAAALSMVIAAAVAFLHFREAPPAAAPETRTEIITPSTTDPISFALSPDGRQIVFVASGDGPLQMWLRRLDMTAAQPLPGTEGASYPFWSPDNRSIGFFAGGKLKRVDLGGGLPRTLTDAADRGGAWSPDGTILFARSVAGSLFRIPASGGEPVTATRFEKQVSHRFPQFLPGGRQFLFYAVGPPGTRGIYLGSLDSPETKRLIAADEAGMYAPNGWLLFVRGGTLLAQRLNLGRGQLTGDTETVADAIAFNGITYASALSVSAAGLIAYRSSSSSRSQLVWFDRAGKALAGLGSPDATLFTPRLSPDSHRVALSRRMEGNDDIWLLDGARSTRFTFDTGSDAYPVWSPDGSRLVFMSNRKGVFDLYLKPSNNTAGERLLLESAQTKVPTDWSRDGHFVLYFSLDPQTSRDIWVLPMDGDRKPLVFLKSNFEEAWAQFSPDGRWVAYASDESGRYEVYVRPFSEGSSQASTGDVGGQWQVSTSGGVYPRWRSDGKELYYIAPDGKLMAAPITVKGTTLESGTPIVLFQTRIVGGGTQATIGPQYDVSRDGRFLVNTELNEAAPITLIQNWSSAAK